MMKRTAVIALPLAAMLGLAACSQADEDKNYEADAVDQSGGELIVTDEDPNAVPVDTPDTPMTPVPTDEASQSAMPGSETTPDE